MERSYSGMNSAYYVGIQSVYHSDPEESLHGSEKAFEGGNNPHSPNLRGAHPT